MKAKTVHFWLRVVEITSLPLAALLLAYLLSGYGLILPGFTRVLGFDYRVSHYLHTHPLLRYATALLTALHGCGGLVLLANRYLRSALSRGLLEAIGFAYMVLVLLVATAAELRLALGPP